MSSQSPRDPPRLPVMTSALPITPAQEEARAMFQTGRPITASIMRALQHSGGEALAELDPNDARPAIVLLGESLVRRAIAGDNTAAQMIADRSEGRVGVRLQEVDPGGEATRAGVQQAIEDVIGALTEARLRQLKT
jgi:hypothetical protein